MAVEHLSKGNDDGTTLGQSASDLISFHNATPCDQAAAVTCASSSAVTSVCGNGAMTIAQASAVIVAVNALLDMAKEKGLMATS